MVFSTRSLLLPLPAASVLVALLLALGCQGRSGHRRWTPESFPNPAKHPKDCGRGHVGSSWVCDPDGVISSDSANVVEGLLKAITQGEKPFVRASCGTLGPQGFQVAVALMMEFELRVGVSAEAQALAFAKRLHDAWGVGEAECNNGVLVLLSVHNRQLYISTGTGATDALTYDVLGQIIDNVKPLLRQKQYDSGIEQVVLDVGLVLSGRPPISKAASSYTTSGGGGGGGEGSDDTSLLYIFGGVVAAMFGWSYWTSRKQRTRFQTCKEKLAKLKRDQKLARAGHAYEFTTCPICLEDLQQPAPDPALAAAAATAAAAAAAAVASAATSAASPAGAGDASTSDCAHGKSEVQPLLDFGDAASAKTGVASAAAGAAGESAAGSSGEAAPVGKVPIVLLCGHAFCEPCIEKWLTSKVTCPICRKAVDEEDGDAPRAPRPPCSAGDDGSAEDSQQQEQQRRRANPGGAYESLRQQQHRLAWRRRQGMGMGVMGDELLLAELAFRARSMHYQFPDVVTQQAAEQMAADVTQGVDLASAAALESVQLSNAAARSRLAASGSGGAGRSFGGGGGGGGGGGRGGGW